MEHGLSFMVLPDEASAGRMAEVARQVRSAQGLVGSLIPAARLHVSMLGLGVYPETPHAEIEAARAAGGTVEFRPFDVELDHVLGWSPDSARPHLVMRGGEGEVGLLMLREALQRAVAGTSLQDRSATFTPHITLMYADRAVAEQAIVPIRWTVREFALVESLRGRSRYITHGRWRLG